MDSSCRSEPQYAPGDATGLGNVPRNCIIGPAQKNLDFTLGITFLLTERQSLRFRTGFFNLFNHPSFANPSSLDAALTVLMERRISGKFVFAFHGIPALRDQYSDYRGKGF